MSDHVRIALYEGKGLIGTLIRWQTRSRWSHAALLLPDGSVIEAREGIGVRRVKHPDLRHATVFRVKGLVDGESDEVIEWAEWQIGRKYDWLAIGRFLSRRQMTDNDRWFCSELVYEAFAQAGCHLLHPSVESWEVSPAKLGMSPLIVEDD